MDHEGDARCRLDHKPKLKKLFPSSTTKSFAWHRYGRTEYYYDVWSNVHYGYVGLGVGFGEDALLDGAGLEQTGSDLARLRWPKSTGATSGLRRFDDFSDRIAISLGIDLYRLVPDNISASLLVQKVVRTPGLFTRPAASS